MHVISKCLHGWIAWISIMYADSRTGSGPVEDGTEKMAKSPIG